MVEKTQKNFHPIMPEPSNHARILSGGEGSRCLDTIQLQKIERSFRSWAEGSRRLDIRLSRKRILMIFLLIRYTGARLNEVLNLDPHEDIDYENHIVHLCKTAAESDRLCRQVEISEELSSEMSKNLDDLRSGGASDRVLWVDPGHVRRKFYERSEASGIPRELGSPEVIRRSRAVELLQSNVPLPVVQRLLGHSTPNRAASYVEFSDDEMRQVSRHFIDKETQRKTSARNAFFGKIKTVEKGDIQAIVEIVSIGGYRIKAAITKNSLSRLGLKPGALVTGEIKAPWVILYKGEEEPNTSAENLFRGTVQGIAKGSINSEVVVRIQDGTELCSVLTEQSRQRLNIKENDALWVAFNAFAVILHVD